MRGFCSQTQGPRHLNRVKTSCMPIDIAAMAASCPCAAACPEAMVVSTRAWLPGRTSQLNTCHLALLKASGVMAKEVQEAPLPRGVQWKLGDVAEAAKSRPSSGKCQTSTSPSSRAQAKSLSGHLVASKG